VSRDVDVRPAESSDVEGIYRVMRRSRREAFEGVLPAAALDWTADPTEGFRESVEATRAHDEQVMLVAVADGTVVGVAELGWQFHADQPFVGDSDAELHAIHVRPADWGEGIGTELLDEAIAELPPRVSALALSVLEGNERARAFYEHRGFERAGTTVTTYAGEERQEVVYRRSL